ncbi:DNA/RNA non-specific endonuclease [Fructilactobacillus frigidiflavus]|uniref:DNA/RNA non-specific endonuclease n=1 Tax=Fructilactobacillus frigidiflavus TaxID=3242688 RepID=UPI0037570D27
MKTIKCITATMVVAALTFVGTFPTGEAAVNPKQTGTYTELASENYQSGAEAYETLNSDQPETIQPSDYKQNKIDYSNLDQLNRAGTATAYLTKNNLGKSSGRAAQVFKPTGWNNQPKKINGERVFPVNRGHLIAYTCTFNLNRDGNYQRGAKGSIDNPKNLITQSAFSNQKVMQITEEMVRNALEENKKVIYQVTPVYQDMDLMAKGVWVEATSTDGSMHFNRYLYNVQPGIAFDYGTGRSTVDTSMSVPTPVNYASYHPKKINKWHTNYDHKNYHVKKHFEFK